MLHSPSTPLTSIHAVVGDGCKNSFVTFGAVGLREWLPSLTPRSKWRREQRDVAVDDVVVVVSADTTRGQWPLARVVEVFRGQDGHVRVAKVKIGQKFLTRPIHKLCPLLEA